MSAEKAYTFLQPREFLALTYLEHHRAFWTPWQTLLKVSYAHETQPSQGYAAIRKMIWDIRHKLGTSILIQQKNQGYRLSPLVSTLRLLAEAEKELPDDVSRHAFRPPGPCCSAEKENPGH